MSAADARTSTAMGLAIVATSGVLLAVVGVVALLSGTTAGQIGDSAFRMVCHGIDARSISFGEMVLPVCARCTGVYLGLLISGLVLSFQKRRNLPVWMSLLILPLAVDGTAQALGVWSSENLWRFTTGMLFSPGAVAILLWLQRPNIDVEQWNLMR